MNHPRKLGLATLALLTVLISLVAVPAATAARRSAVVVTAFPNGTVVQHQKAWITGRVVPGARRHVELQRYTAGRWRTIATSTAHKGGRVRVSLETADAGTASYRLKATRTPRYAAATSRSVRIRVAPLTTNPHEGGTDRGTATNLTGPYIVVYDGGGLRRVEVEGGGSAPELKNVNFDYADITPAGKLISVEGLAGDGEFLSDRTIYVGGGNAARHLVSTAPTGRCYSSVTWDADGRYALVGEAPFTEGSCGDADLVRVLDTLTGSMTTVGPTSWDDRNHYYALGSGGDVAVTDVESGTITIASTQSGATTPVPVRGLTNVEGAIFSPQGDLLVRSYPADSGDGAADFALLSLHDPAAAPQLVVTTSMSSNCQGNLCISNDVQFSPDGSRIAWVDRDADAGVLQVLVANADGTHRSVVAKMPDSYSSFHKYNFVYWVGNRYLLYGDSDSETAHVVPASGGSATWTGGDGILGWIE